MSLPQAPDRVPALGAGGPPTSGPPPDMRGAERHLARLNLSDQLARQIQLLIRQSGYLKGERLPSIRELARRFGVGSPTVREALKKLETVGTVRIRAGSGVYVSRADQVLVVATPDFDERLSKELLLDLMDARIPMETLAAALAARQARPEQLMGLRTLVASVAGEARDVHLRHSIAVAFHEQVGAASGNTVLCQLSQVLQGYFGGKERMVPGIAETGPAEHEEHLRILQALESRDEELAGERMRTHLEGVRQRLLGWEPPDTSRIPA